MIKVFNEEEKNKELPGIIIISHGPLAKAILDSAAMLNGKKLENSAALCLEENDDPYEFGAACADTIKKFQEGSIVMADIYGGTPCNQLIMNLKKNNLKIIGFAGVSLPLLLNASMARTTYRGRELLEFLMQDKENYLVSIKSTLD